MTDKSATLVESLAVTADSKILMVVLDGLGGIPRDNKTELEAAWTPNLDRLAARSSLGTLVPVEVGITPGSGPAHLALFGYDPQEWQVGRGVIEALGIGLDVNPGDLCFRANFATLAPDGTIADRRAGRIASEQSAELCRMLQEHITRIGEYEVIVRPGREHRFVVLFRGTGLSDAVGETDPQHNGAPPLPVEPLGPEAGPTAELVNDFIRRATGVLAGRKSANGILLRGPGTLPQIPSFGERYRLRAACVALYPMYRGLARLVGMDLIEFDSTATARPGDNWLDQLEALRGCRADYDFCYLHLKDTDKAGEDGDFDAKVELLERFDEEILPCLSKLEFDVLCITGDHSTPAVMGRHSWHPVPFLLHSRHIRPQVSIDEFGERACTRGQIGRIMSRQAMALLLAHADRLAKYGA